VAKATTYKAESTAPAKKAGGRYKFKTNCKDVQLKLTATVSSSKSQRG